MRRLPYIHTRSSRRKYTSTANTPNIIGKTNELSLKRDQVQYPELMNYRDKRHSSRIFALLFKSGQFGGPVDLR